MALEIKKARKYAHKLRIGLGGPTGSGKTKTGLEMGTELARNEGGRLLVIDTEHGTASLYAEEYDFDVIELTSFAPDRYIEAIHFGEASPEHVVIMVDSLSHAWIGKDGELEQVDKLAAKNHDNSFIAWRHVTPQHNSLVEALVSCKKHLIVTMRSKMAYELQEQQNGTKKPVKLGMAPMMRDGIEYEFDVYAEIAIDHTLEISKTRCAKVDGYRMQKAGRELAGILWEWAQGDAAPEKEPEPEKVDQFGRFARPDGGLNQIALLGEMKRQGLDTDDMALVAKPLNGSAKADIGAWFRANPQKTVEQLLEEVKQAKAAKQPAAATT